MSNQSNKYQYEIKLLNEVEEVIKNILIENMDLVKTREELMSLSQNIGEFKRSNSNKQHINYTPSSCTGLQYPDFML